MRRTPASAAWESVCEGPEAQGQRQLPPRSRRRLRSSSLSLAREPGSSKTVSTMSRVSREFTSFASKRSRDSSSLGLHSEVDLPKNPDHAPTRRCHASAPEGVSRSTWRRASTDETSFSTSPSRTSWTTQRVTVESSTSKPVTTSRCSTGAAMAMRLKSTDRCWGSFRPASSPILSVISRDRETRVRAWSSRANKFNDEERIATAPNQTVMPTSPQGKEP
jgi:hypothetical protein